MPLSNGLTLQMFDSCHVPLLFSQLGNLRLAMPAVHFDLLSFNALRATSCICIHEIALKIQLFCSYVSTKLLLELTFISHWILKCKMPCTAAQLRAQLKQIASRHRDAGSSSGHGCTAVGREPANPSPFQEMAVTVPRPKQILSLSSVLGLSHRQRASISLSGVHSHVDTGSSPFLCGWPLMSFTFWKLVEWLRYFSLMYVYTHIHTAICLI